MKDDLIKCALFCLPKLASRPPPSELADLVWTCLRCNFMRMRWRMCCDGDKYVSAWAGAGTGRAGTHSDPHCDFLAWLRAGGNILPTTGVFKQKTF